MKTLALAVALLATGGLAQAADMKGMEMKDMSPTRMHKEDTGGKHSTKGIVKKVDAKASTVTLDHEPVQSLKWPAMTMKFKVKDKATLDKLPAGKTVDVEFEQRGKDYVITKAK